MWDSFIRLFLACTTTSVQDQILTSVSRVDDSEPHNGIIQAEVMGFQVLLDSILVVSAQGEAVKDDRQRLCTK